MLLINRLTKPGGIKRIELRPDIVRIFLQDGTERIYIDNRPRHIEQADYGHLDAVADMTKEG